MATTNPHKASGGQYVCARCSHGFDSIADLRAHEKLCRAESGPLAGKSRQAAPEVSRERR